MSKIIHKSYVGTTENLHDFLQRYADALKIENAEVYWLEESGSVVLFASQEWKEYLTGRSDILPTTKENNNESN